MTREFAEIRVATGACRNCLVGQGEVVWSGWEPDYRWLCMGCGLSYGRRAPHLAPNQVPAGAEVVPEGFVRYPEAAA